MSISNDQVWREKPKQPIVAHHLIVIGIPCYNEVQYISETIRSVKAQTWSDFAVLISDNCSNDGTLDIIRAEIGDDRRFTLHRHLQNIGSAENFNFVQRITESPYLVWLGAHDLLAPTFLARHLEAFRAKPDISVSQSLQRYIDEHGADLEVISDGDLSPGTPASVRRYLRSIGRNKHNVGANSMIRRDFIGRFVFTATIGTDRILLSQLAFCGPFNSYQDVLYRRRSFRSARKSYMERLSGEAGAQDDWFKFDWSKMAREYDQNLCTLASGKSFLPLYRFWLAVTLRYYLPVGYGSVATMALWTVRRLLKRLF